MSKHDRGRITVQNQPTASGRFVRKGIGAVHATMGFVFVFLSITMIIPNAGVFGLPFLVGGGFFFLNGIRMIVTKNDVPHRIGYDIERDSVEETIVGLTEDVDKKLSKTTDEERPASPSTENVRDARNIQNRLLQLEQLKKAGIITQKEYEEKRRSILDEL